MQPGTVFTSEKEGLTIGGFGIVKKMYEVEQQLPSGNYSCKLIYDNTIPKINPLYREQFNEEQINKLIENERKKNCKSIISGNVVPQTE